MLHSVFVIIFVFQTLSKITLNDAKLNYAKPRIQAELLGVGPPTPPPPRKQDGSEEEAWMHAFLGMG